MDSHNTISIDEVKFLKTSKKLLNTLSTEHKVELKLSQMQEMLAQCLGFRNLHELQQNFNRSTTLENTNSEAMTIQKRELISSIRKPDIFDNIEIEQAVQIVYNLMDSSGGGDMWRSRAISLLISVLKALIHMRDNKELVLDAETIREYMILDNILKLYKTRRDFPDSIRRDLRAYLTSLPGFQESAPKQNDTVLEQHGYLQMQFLGALNRLKDIESNNFIIADNDWFIYDTKERIVSTSMGKEKQTTTETYQIFTINPLLRDFDFIEDSWLSMNEYEDWVANLFHKRKLKEIRVSDLLVYVTTIISPHRRNTMYLVLNSILDNYSIASQISAQITKKLKLTR